MFHRWSKMAERTEDAILPIDKEDAILPIGEEETSEG